MKTILYLIIPCYNEEHVLPVTSGQFLDELLKLIRLEKISSDSKILFVDDGSSDRTWEIIRQLAAEERYFAGIRQSRNRGHQNAVLAGLMEVKEYADITISIDCDGQDDIGAIEKMVDAYHDGNESVFSESAYLLSAYSFRDRQAYGKGKTCRFYRFLRAGGICEFLFFLYDVRSDVFIWSHSLSGLIWGKTERSPSSVYVDKICLLLSWGGGSRIAGAFAVGGRCTVRRKDRRRGKRAAFL